MKNSFQRRIGFAFLSAMLLAAAALAQEKATLGILDIKPTPSLAALVKPDAKAEMNRIVESLDGQLIDRINATHKFDVVSRSDADQITREQQFGASGNVDPKTAAKMGKDLGAKFILTATVDDFQDYYEQATFAATGDTATKRVFRFSIVAKIYDSTTGKLLTSANIQTGNDRFKQIQQERNYSVKNGLLSDEMMVAVSRDMAQQIANHVADTIFPAKVLIKNDEGVTINRGDDGSVAIGDTFNVYALGQELIDPDTKESLGREEVKVGKVQIVEVDPNFSKAKILEDTGIDKGAILRRPR